MSRMLKCLLASALAASALQVNVNGIALQKTKSQGSEKKFTYDDLETLVDTPITGRANRALLAGLRDVVTDFKAVVDSRTNLIGRTRADQEAMASLLEFDTEQTVSMADQIAR